MTLQPILVITLLCNTSSEVGIQNNNMCEMYFKTKSDKTKSQNSKFLTNRYIGILQIPKFHITKFLHIHNSVYHSNITITTRTSFLHMQILT